MSSFLFPFVLVIDSFLTSVTYGANEIKISKQSIIIISLIGTLFLSISLLFASTIKSILPNYVSNVISFSLLFLLGCSNLISMRSKKKETTSFDRKKVPFVIDVYFDGRKADIDHSSSLSLKETIVLAIALSFDSLLSGFGIGLSMINIPILLILSFLLNIFSISIGIRLGKKVSDLNQNCSWASSIIFFILAFSKLF